MLANYISYLKFLDEKLSAFFKSQAPFVFCKKGCALCCKNSEFPYSAIEARYLLQGALTLEKEKQELVAKNISMLLQKKKNFKGEKFKYDCPFLIDNACCLYEYRGVICRAFGLMTSYQDGKIKAPFCSDVGLNYSNVLNLKKNVISPAKYKKLKVKEEPLGFNISYKYLTNEEFEQTFGFKFGEKRALIDWF